MKIWDKLGYFGLFSVFYISFWVIFSIYLSDYYPLLTHILLFLSGIFHGLISLVRSDTYLTDTDWVKNDRYTHESNWDREVVDE